MRRSNSMRDTVAGHITILEAPAAGEVGTGQVCRVVEASQDAPHNVAWQIMCHLHDSWNEVAWLRSLGLGTHLEAPELQYAPVVRKFGCSGAGCCNCTSDLQCCRT